MLEPPHASSYKGGQQSPGKIARPMQQANCIHGITADAIKDNHPIKRSLNGKRANPLQPRVVEISKPAKFRMLCEFL